jgi:hypothetical protein
MVCVLNLRQFSFEVRVVLSKTFIGPRRGIDQRWFLEMELLHHLEQSIWTFELEHALEVFSLSTYLNCVDYRDPSKAELDHLFHYDNFTETFLRYLEHKVSKSCSQTKFQLQLLILIRENLNFISTIYCVTWNMLTLPSIIPQLERNSGS